MLGELFFKHGEKDKIAAVGLLTQLHEKRVNGDKALKMRDASRDYIKIMIEGIVVIEFHIKRLDAKSKLSQNREQIDYTAVMDRMEEMQLMGLSQSMKKLLD